MSVLIIFCKVRPDAMSNDPARATAKDAELPSPAPTGSCVSTEIRMGSNSSNVAKYINKNALNTASTADRSSPVNPPIHAM